MQPIFLVLSAQPQKQVAWNLDMRLSGQWEGVGTAVGCDGSGVEFGSDIPRTLGQSNPAFFTRPTCEALERWLGRRLFLRR